jgi:hypothetical protein
MIRIERRIVVYGEVWYDEEPLGDSGVDIVIYRHRKVPIADARSTPFLSLIVDLSGDEETIADQFSRNCRYEIRRAETKDGLRMDLLMDPESRLDEFRAFYDAFASQKALPLSDREWLVAACKARRLALTVASRNAESLVWHAYILSGRTARLLHSGSCFRNRESEYRALVGRANRWLHWKDMLQLKAMGTQCYDWGGLFEDESVPERAGINNFKKGFGGQQERTYDCTVPASRRGRLWLPLREAWRRWNTARK